MESNNKKVVFEKPSNQNYNTRVKLQLLIDAHAIYDGLVTGEHYEWQKAGSIVSVDSRDSVSLLEKHIKTQSCCNQHDSRVFQQVD